MKYWFMEHSANSAFVTDLLLYTVLFFPNTNNKASPWTALSMLRGQKISPREDLTNCGVKPLYSADAAFVTDSLLYSDNKTILGPREPRLRSIRILLRKGFQLIVSCCQKSSIRKDLNPFLRCQTAVHSANAAFVTDLLLYTVLFAAPHRFLVSACTQSVELSLRRRRGKPMRPRL